jgi:hypothetical protein
MWWGTMSINQQQTEFIQTLDGVPSPEQAAQLLELGMGDTGAKAQPEQSGEPNAAAGTDDPSKANDKPKAGDGGSKAEGDGAKAPEPDPENTVILAKDGKHTIGYEKLVEAREAAQTWKQKAEEAQQQLEALKAQAAARIEAGEKPTPTDANVEKAQAAIDKGVDPAVFGDFSDEAIAKGIATLIEQKAGAILAAVDAKLEPLNKRQQTSVEDAHYQAIYAKHPDADSLSESQELKSWIDAQPSFVRGAYQGVLEKGTTEQVIELFDRFKQATVKAPDPKAQPSADAVKAAAAAAIAKAQTSERVPASLSDFPGGRAGAGATRDEAWAQFDGPALIDAMAEASPEQIERFLNRRV